MVQMQTNRAMVVAVNAEIRRMKARLMDEVPKLQKLAQKKVHFLLLLLLLLVRQNKSNKLYLMLVKCVHVDNKK